MYELNEILTLKKPHPCGGRNWKIMRVGADVKLQCVTCGKYVNLTREELRKNAKAAVDLQKAAVNIQENNE